jgi:isocitrate dehydrogenase
MDEKQTTHNEEPESGQRHEENARLYDKFAERAQELFRASRDKSREALEAAVEKARRQLTESGLFSSERGKAFKEYFMKDFYRFAEYSRELGGEAKEKLEPSRLGTGALASLSSLLHLAGEALRGLAQKTDQALSCKTGELTSAGSLTCENCGRIIHLKKTGRIPPCPECTGTHFKKGY